MFKAMGFTQQISDIYSFGKLTGHGITLLGGDLLKILEVSLPRGSAERLSTINWWNSTTRRGRWSSCKCIRDLG